MACSAPPQHGQASCATSMTASSRGRWDGKAAWLRCGPAVRGFCRCCSHCAAAFWAACPRRCSAPDPPARAEADQGSTARTDGQTGCAQGAGSAAAACRSQPRVPARRLAAPPAPGRLQRPGRAASAEGQIDPSSGARAIINRPQLPKPGARPSHPPGRPPAATRRQATRSRSSPPARHAPAAQGPGSGLPTADPAALFALPRT